MKNNDTDECARTEGCFTERNGTRPKLHDDQLRRCRATDPRPGTGSFFPSIRGPRRRIDQALEEVVMETYFHGILIFKRR